MSEHNPVSNPAHYTVYPVQPIALTRHLGFCLGNAVKYVLRAPYKGAPVEDLNKALQYLEWEEETPSPSMTVSIYAEFEQDIEVLVHFLAGGGSVSSLNIPDRVAELQSDFLLILDRRVLGSKDSLVRPVRDLRNFYEVYKGDF
ncbi:DUF3310 domain-containing protein [Desulfovibrio sp. OttesenSCG-928-C06]|nr:DUF3310 domain-containing protein [Desulfovibrio sp. OttesenSCG-928-C06]